MELIPIRRPPFNKTQLRGVDMKVIRDWKYNSVLILMLLLVIIIVCFAVKEKQKNNELCNNLAKIQNELSSKQLELKDLQSELGVAQSKLDVEEWRNQRLFEMFYGEWKVSRILSVDTGVIPKHDAEKLIGKLYTFAFDFAVIKNLPRYESNGTVSSGSDITDKTLYKDDLFYKVNFSTNDESFLYGISRNNAPYCAYVEVYEGKRVRLVLEIIDEQTMILLEEFPFADTTQRVIYELKLNRTYAEIRHEKAEDYNN